MEYYIQEGQRRYKGCTCEEKNEEANTIVVNLSGAVNKFVTLIKKGKVSKEITNVGQDKINK